MALTLMNAPAAAGSLIQEHVPLLLRMGGDDTITDGAPLEAAGPYPLFTFSITDVVSAQPLRAARLTAWQYLLVSGETVVGIGEVAAVDRHGAPRLEFAALYPRDYADAIARTIVEAESFPEVAVRDYELRILRGPSVSLLAVWLHGGEDLLLPVRRAGKPAKELWHDSELVNGEEALNDLLHATAEQRLNTDS